MTPAIGARLLRSYLDFAERGVEALRSEITQDGDRDFDSPFEREVARAPERRRMAVHRQVGCGGFRIDRALVDPAQHGRYVLVVEGDGATYHGSATARDRDRLRQQVLEDLGWTICRVWSTDWFQNPAAQVERVLAAYERAKKQIDLPTSSIAPEEFVAPEPPLPPPADEPGEPTIRLATPSYGDIDQVPSSAIGDLVLELLRRYGATEEADVTREVAQRLGFRRTGGRIKARIVECIEALVRGGLVGRDDGRLQPVSPRANVS